MAINRYYAWYSDPGHTEVIAQKLYSDLANWRRARGGRGSYRLVTVSAVSRVPGKPVMLTEYGADTVAGLHMEPSMVFTEEYQVPPVMCPVRCCHSRLTCAG